MKFSGNISLLKAQQGAEISKNYEKINLTSESGKSILHGNFGDFKRLVVQGWLRTKNDNKQVFFQLPYNIEMWGSERTFTIGDAIFMSDNLQGHNVFLLHKDSIEFRNINGQALNYEFVINEIIIWGVKK